MIIGYRLTGLDNGSYMLGEETRPASTPEERQYFDWRFIKNGSQHPATCAGCGRKIDTNYVDSAFKLCNKRLDVGATYDGYMIVSERFRDFCNETGIADIEFIPLPSQQKHYWFRSHRILEVDMNASRDIRLLYHCDICDSYAGIFGTSHLKFIGVDTVMPKGVFRTDLEFAQAHEQSPLIVVDPDLAESIKAQKFKGICLNKIEA